MFSYISNSDYKELIKSIKCEILRSRQIAIRKVNSELIVLYYNIGKNIFLKQKDSNWGDDLIGQIEKDLKKDFPDLRGFSRRNINYMRNLYIFFKNEKFVQQVVAQIPWGHIIVILTKIKDIKEANLYVLFTH